MAGSVLLLSAMLLVLGADVTDVRATMPTARLLGLRAGPAAVPPAPGRPGGSLRLRGGSRATAQARAKARYLAMTVERSIETARDRAEQRKRIKLADEGSTGVTSATSMHDAELQRIERELGALEHQPFSPPRDPASLAAAERRAAELTSKYAPGEIVEISDSDEWHRATEGESGTATHSIPILEDQTALIQRHNMRYARAGTGKDGEGLHGKFHERHSRRPDGAWMNEVSDSDSGGESVPRLEWGQDPAEIAGVLGVPDKEQELEQWIGEEELERLQQAEAAAREGAAIDVEARARDLLASLVREAAEEGAGGELAQPVASWMMCLQVARRENAKAQEEALEQLRIKRLRYDPEIDDSSSIGAHLPQVSDEFASDTSNSTDLWERRDDQGRLLPPGVRRIRMDAEVPTQVGAQWMANQTEDLPEFRGWNDWELLTADEVWTKRWQAQEQVKTLLADMQLHLGVAQQHQDTREAESWQTLMHKIRIEAGLEGPNAPTETDVLDEAKQREFARKYDLKRQAVELEKYEDALPDMLLQSGLGEEEEEAAWDKVKQAAIENDLDGVLGMGEERRAAVADSAALVLEKGEKRSPRDRSGPVEWDMTPMLDKDDFVEKSQDVFLLQQARDSMLMLQDNSHKHNGIYEDGESFSDTEKYLQINDRPLPPGTARLPNGGIVVSDLDLPEDLPRYREGIDIEYRARRQAAALCVRNVHLSAEGSQAREGGGQAGCTPPNSQILQRAFEDVTAKRQRQRVDANVCKGMLYVWGGNMCNQLAVESLGDQPWVTSSRFFRPGTVYHSRIERIYAGGFHTICTLRATSQEPLTTVAFGYNRFGQLGVGAMPHGDDEQAGVSIDDPSTFSAAHRAQAQAMFGDDWLQLLSNATAWYGSLDVDMRNIIAPVEVEGLRGTEVSGVACGLFHTLFLAGRLEDGRQRVLACGNNDAGQLGLGHRAAHVRNRSPQCVEALGADKVLSVHAGWEFSLALLEGGTVVGWGWNTYGQLGIAGAGAAGDQACYSTPTAMAGFGEVDLCMFPHKPQIDASRLNIP